MPSTKKKIFRESYFLLLLVLVCVSADAATLFTVLDDFGSRNNFDALDATFFEVNSPFAFAMYKVFMPLI